MPQEVLLPDKAVGNDEVLGGKTKTADDINDLFRELDKEPEKPSKEAKEKEESKEPKKEIEKDDEELELVGEENEEDKPLDLKEEENLEIEASPRKKEVLAKYPDLFKTFPWFEKMMYRDKQYTELFGSFDDAKEIAERSESFNEFENQLLSGNTVEILKNVKEADQKAFDTIVDDYLPNLAKVDKEAYYHVVGNLNKMLIQELIAEGKRVGGEQEEAFQQAALLVNQYVFGTSNFTPPKARVDKTQEPAKKEIEEERLSFVREQYETHRDEMQSRVDNRLRATISEYIDPRGQMSSYVKKNAVNDAMRYLEEAIANDESVIKNLDKLWRAAFDSKFRKDSLGRIESFYLSKARQNLKKAILQARSEALKDSRIRDRETDEEEEEQPRQRVEREVRKIPTGRPSQPKSKNEMKRGESIMDFFMRD